LAHHQIGRGNHFEPLQIRVHPWRFSIRNFVGADAAPLILVDFEPTIFVLRLSDFSISHFHPLNLTQSNIVPLAQAWGHTLTHFDLNSSPTGQRMNLNIMKLDLTALVPLAQHCRQLQYLKIQLNATVPVASGSVGFQSSTFSTELRIIDFGSSHITSHADVALFLLRMTPVEGNGFVVDGVGQEGDGSSQGVDLWAKVNASLERMHRRRVNQLGS
jgi:hypothetical protein